MISLYELLLTVSSPVANAAFDCGRSSLAGVVVVDGSGALVPTSFYSATVEELAAGILHWSGTATTTGHPAPWRVAAAPGLILPSNLLWTNEFDWQDGLSQAATPTFCGSVVLESFKMLAGREIRLAPPAPDLGLMDYAQVQALDAFASIAGKRFILLFNGRYYPVVFGRPGAIEAKPALGFTNHASGERWTCSLFFLTV